MPRASTRSGFSLVEVLVAIAVLTIGILAFLEIFPGGIMSLQVAANVSAADRLAQAQLNQLSPGNGAEIQQVAAVESIYAATDGSGTNMVQLDPSFNLDRAISPSSGLTTVYDASSPSTPVSTGFDIASSSTGSTGTALNPEPYEYIGGERVNIPSPTAASAQDTQNAPTGNVMLNFGPLTLPTVSSAAYAYPDLNKFNSLDPNAHCSFFVHGLPWASHPGGSQPLTGAVAATAAPGTPVSLAYDDPESELKLNSPEYLIDYANCAIALRNPSQLDATGAPVQPYAQTFIFQVSVLHGGVVTPHTFLFAAQWPGAVNATSSANRVNFFDTNNHSRWVTFLPSQDANGNAVTPPSDIAASSLMVGDTFVPGTEKLVRDFKEIDAPKDFDADPYEFALPTTIFPNNSYQIGELMFNSRASAIMDTRGQPLQASVDYIVQDWRTLHEDRTLGEQASASQGALASTTVRMTLKKLLKLNASDTNATPYHGIADGGTGTEILVYDLDTFQQIPEATPAQVQANNDAGMFYPDYANGAITLYGLVTGTHIRVYYRAQDSWGLTVVKPAASYTIIGATANGSTSPVSTGEAVLSDNGQTLYFPQCDAGQSVQIGGTATYTASDGSHTVPLSYLTSLSASASGTATGPTVNIADAIQGGLNGGTITSASPTVSGASITARASWLQSRGIWRSRSVTTVDLPSGK